MFKVHVPATSANIGPGFDVMGLCLDLENIFEVEESNEFKLLGFDPEYSNEYNNLFVKSYKIVFYNACKDVIPIKVKLSQNVPMSRGLGSSSTMIVGGILAANHILGNPFVKEDLLLIATTIEGHPDNVAPAIYGGLTASVLLNKSIFTEHYPVSKDLQFVFMIPNFELSTSLARKALPEMIKHKDAVENTSNLLILLRGLEYGNEELIAKGIKDHLHVQYRNNLINEYGRVCLCLKEHGAIASTISGAGPTVMGIFKKGEIKPGIEEEIKRFDNEWKMIKPEVNYRGAYVE